MRREILTGLPDWLKILIIIAALLLIGYVYGQLFPDYDSLDNQKLNR